MDRVRLERLLRGAITWSVYAVVFCAPFSKSIAEIGIGVAIGAWLAVKALRRDGRLPATGVTVPLAVFVLIAELSLVNSPDLGLSGRAFVTKILKYAVFYFAVVETFADRRRLKGLFIVGLCSAALILVDGLIQYYVTGVDLLHHYPSFKARPWNDADGFYRGFPTASFPFPNDLAAWILLVLLPLGCATLFDLKKRRVRVVTALVSAGLFYLFFLAKARGAWVGLIVSVVYIAISTRKLWLIAILALVIAVPFVAKMEMAKYILQTGSLGDRCAMWTTSVAILKEHPVIGNGVNTFFMKFREFREDQWKGEKGSYAHNCYLQMACDLGLVGLAAFLWMLVAYFRGILQALRRMQDPLLRAVLLGMSTGVFAFLIHSFFDTNLYSLNLTILFWAALGTSQALALLAGREEGPAR